MVKLKDFIKNHVSWFDLEGSGSIQILNAAVTWEKKQSGTWGILLMKLQARQHVSEYTNQEDNTNHYALSRIIEETQKLQAVYWFNLF